jgi:hypothetical protein
MKRYTMYLMVAAAGAWSAGCTSPTGRPDYTASGALAGGATGAIIGSMARHSGPGALVGGAVGAVFGGLVGHGMDQAQEAQLQAQAPQTWQHVEQGQPLTLADIKALAKAGIGDDLLISQIRNSRTIYRLSTADIIDLKNTGVNEKVIDFMINTPATVVQPQPQVAPEPRYYYATPPPYYYPPYYYPRKSSSVTLRVPELLLFWLLNA